MGRAGQSRVGRAIVAVVVAGWVLMPLPSEAAGETALEALLDILRARGSISEQEYQAIRLLAKDESRTPAPAPSAAVPTVGDVAGLPNGIPAASVLPTAPILEQVAAAASANLAQEVPDLVSNALSGKWYEKISLRGYTQFRATEVFSYAGAPPEVPADRSVNANESLMIRRGRFIFSGDPTERLYLYAQSDFNASTGAADYSLQMRDLYADLAFDRAKTWRLRVGQSKVPYGWVNLQSSQNRAPLERPDALNSGAEGERDLGAYLMWASPEARRRFRDLVSLGLKGSGDYGVVAVGAFSGQGLNRSDQDGHLHYLGRVSYPFRLASGQYVEIGAQGYTGRFVTPLQAVNIGGTQVTPSQQQGGVRDERFAATFVLYPQPFGLEAEWTVGRGPTLSEDSRSIGVDPLNGGYVQAHYRAQGTHGTWLPFTRWNYFDGARKFARNAPRTRVNEVDFGLEFARWAEFEVTGMFTRSLERTRTSLYPYERSLRGNRFALQVQWNY